MLRPEEVGAVTRGSPVAVGNRRGLSLSLGRLLQEGDLELHGEPDREEGSDNLGSQNDTYQGPEAWNKLDICGNGCSPVW